LYANLKAPIHRRKKKSTPNETVSISPLLPNKGKSHFRFFRSPEKAKTPEIEPHQPGVLKNKFLAFIDPPEKQEVNTNPSP
jgi:hypothetical protein